jgi:hypothetical protein
MVNMSRPGSTMYEDAERFKERLKTSPPPDLVIFLNGWNDLLVHVAFQFAGDKSKSMANSDFGTLFDAINNRTDAFLASEVGEKAGDLAASVYSYSRDRVLEDAEAYGIEARFFFQPDAVSSKLQLAEYDRPTGVSIDEVMGSPFAIAGETATKKLGSKVTDIRHLFDDFPEPVFIGLVHMNEMGAAITAQTIFRQVLPDLQALAH